MSRIFLVAVSFAVLGLAAPVVLGEDAVDADPNHYSVEFENDRIRVIRVQYGPGEKSVMHTHNANLAVFLTDGKVRMTMPDGNSIDVESRLGATQWAEAEEHLPENLTDEPMEVVLVEIK